jgi:putative endonuclease
MYYTYIIQSIETGRYYIGSTSNISDRLKRHQENRSKATKGRGPWYLVFRQLFPTRSEAMILEFKIKKRGAKRFLEDLNKSG